MLKQKKRGEKKRREKKTDAQSFEGNIYVVVSKMIMDNSKVWPHEDVVKIVHSRYFTVAARLADGREAGNTSRSTRGEQMSLGVRRRATATGV